MLKHVEQKRMRIDPETCRDPDLLAAEVRRLEAVIAAATPTLTDEERGEIRFASALYERGGREDCAATLRSLLERAPRTYFKTAGKRLITNMSGDWIPVSQRLPEIGIRVLCAVRCKPYEHGHTVGALMFYGRWEFDEEYDDATEPTHWMPLPAMPSDGK
jgi:hypothetical protein